MKKQSEFSKLEKKIETEEKTLKNEIQKEQKGLIWFTQSHTFKILLTIVVFIVLLSAIIYLTISYGRTYIDKSEISAPIISLSSQNTGILENVFVKEGDLIPAGTVVAQVGGVPIKSQVLGLVIFTQNTPGQIVNSQTTIVKMIDPNQLRVIGHIKEDKGLKDIRVGQKVIFTVDAFGSNKYSGIVESISESSQQSDIVFSISDKRQEKEFNVKVKFDTNAYLGLKNGMSAKMWVYK